MDFAKSQTKSQKNTNLNNENWKSERKKKDYVRDIQIVSEGIFKEFAFKKQFIFLPFSTFLSLDFKSDYH